MDTRVCRINDNDIDTLKEAAQVIKNGGTVAFPTETVYGLGADALNEDACIKIFAAKGRPQDNPLIVHVAGFDIERYVKYIPQMAKKLMEDFWPGPLTIIMPKSDVIPDKVTAGLDSVAIRMPLNKTARKLIELSKVPIAAPSANISGRPSPTTIEHCIEDLMGKVDMIIGWEKCDVGLESTIVDTTGDNVVILRPGAITREMLEEAIGEVSMDQAVTGKLSDNVKPKAPGMKYRHYAPKAAMTIVRGDIDNMVNNINHLAAQAQKKGQIVGIMATDETYERYSANYKLSTGSRKEFGIIAANIFDCLREFDKINVDCIFAEGFNEDGIGLAIMNRLKKAAGFNILEV
jgi:L-threonylcarbamoyladenylate synthase